MREPWLSSQNLLFGHACVPHSQPGRTTCPGVVAGSPIVSLALPRHDGPVHLVLDSTGLQLFGQGEWDAEKHGRTRRHWRKLHLAVDAGMSEIAAHMLTDGNADDAVQAPVLLRQAEGSIASVIADGAYDSEPVYQAAAARQHDPPPDVVVPPRASAVPSTNDPNAQSPRDRHIRFMAEKGRIGWQKATG
ncbi:MAG TPA: transposase [Steroidobacteraceae bacterium]|nr:transposase [Steroidobacteraceae bacterium]